MAMPQMTPEKAEEMITLAEEALHDESFKADVQAAVAAVEADNPGPEKQAERQLMLVQRLMPLAIAKLGDKWAPFGVNKDNAMMVMMQVQMVSMTKPDLM